MNKILKSLISSNNSTLTTISYNASALTGRSGNITLIFSLSIAMLTGLLMKSVTSTDGITLLNSSLLISNAVIKAILTDGSSSLILLYNSKPFMFGILISVIIKS